MTRFLRGGRYYELTRDGLRDAAAEPPADAVAAVVCRRIVDYPNGEPPAGGEIGQCVRCCALVAFNPAGPHRELPRVCMQCAGITPLPIEPS